MRKLILFLILLSNQICLFGFSILKTQSESQEEAQAWAKKYLSDASNHDIQLVANLLYWSYKRSEINLKAQDCARENLETMFKCWQNISATRLNPSKNFPNKLSSSEIKISNEIFLDCYLQHKNIGQSYASCMETVLKKSVLENKLVKDGIIELRQSARWVMGRALLSAGFIVKSTNLEKSSFQGMICRDHKLPAWLLSPFDLSIKTFVQLDSEYNKAVTSYQGALLKAQDASNMIWKAIESSRSEFYKEHYKVVIDFMKSKKIKETDFNILFSCENCISRLPEKL